MSLNMSKAINILYVITYVSIPVVAYNINGEIWFDDPMSTLLTGVALYSVIGLFHAFSIFINLVSETVNRPINGD